MAVVDEALIRKIAARQAGAPQRIVGETEIIEVNGKVVDAPLAPMRVRGVWLVPAKPVAEALGAVITMLPTGEAQMTYENRTYVFTPGEDQAALDSQTRTLPARAARVEGNVVVPVRAFIELTGATFEWEKGKTLRLTSAAPTPTPPQP